MTLLARYLFTEDATSDRADSSGNGLDLSGNGSHITASPTGHGLFVIEGQSFARADVPCPTSRVEVALWYKRTPRTVAETDEPIVVLGSHYADDHAFALYRRMSDNVLVWSVTKSGVLSCEVPCTATHAWARLRAGFDVKAGTMWLRAYDEAGGLLDEHVRALAEEPFPGLRDLNVAKDDSGCFMESAIADLRIYAE